MRCFPVCRAVFLTLAVASPGQSRIAQAQIITDGTLGPSLSLNGPNYQISSTLGQIYGKNLFHSFQEFNLSNSQSATFSGPASIANILSRVTGGNPSLIDGSLNSTIAGANFFFINPSGIVFGPDAQVNVGGSFVATTADLVRLRDGGVFHAQNPSSTVLSSAPPSAFGFLNAQPAPILVDGSLLQVTTGKRLSLIGGDVALGGAALVAESGKVNIVSTGSAGEVTLNANNPASHPALNGFTKLGTIGLDGSVIDVGDDPAASSGGLGGSVNVRGENLILDHSSGIIARNSGTTSGGSFDIHLDGGLVIIGNSVISAKNEGSGAGQHITVKADSIALEGEASFDRQAFSGIQSITSETGSGKGGNIDVSTKSLQILNGARISTNTSGSGEGGNITINADNIELDGQFNPKLTGVAAQTLAGAPGGSIVINTKALNILGGSEISASTIGSGDGGSIAVKADKLVLDGQGAPFFTGIAAGTFARVGGGDGGQITVDAKNLHIFNGAEINAETQGNGNGGNIAIKADSIVLDGQNNPDPTGIIARTLANPGGRAGNITVDTKTLHILRAADINTNTSGNGAGGNIRITADSVVLDQAGDVVLDAQGELKNTGIEAITTSEDKGSKGGNIRIATKSLQVLDGAVIFVSTNGSGDGGNISIKSENIVLGGQGSTQSTGIFAQTTADSQGGNGGRVNVDTKTLKILAGGEISASTFGDGKGGDIIIKADDILLDGRNNPFFTGIAAGTFAHSRGGNGGKIRIVSDRLRLLNGGEISANTRGSGLGGNISIKAGEVLLDGAGDARFTGIDAGSIAPGSGNGDSINIQSNSLHILNGGQISTTTEGQGKGGNITIVTGDLLIDGANAPLDPQGIRLATSINAETLATTNGGTGGNITINAARLDLKNDADISTSSNGSGNGGDITANARSVSLTGDSAIASHSRGSGNAGAIVVKAIEGVTLTGGSSIITSAEQVEGGTVVIEAANGDILLRGSRIDSFALGNGGGITLKAAGLISLRNSVLNAQTENGVGGNITVDSRFVVVDRSELNANAKQGNGGNISIRAEVFLPSIESRITASSELGVANNGDIVIEAPNPNIGGSLVRLSTSPLSAESYLQERCRLRRGKASSFVVGRQGLVAPDPSAPLPSLGTK